MDLTQKAGKYFEWCYSVCDKLEGRNLEEYTESFISMLTPENLTPIFGREVTSELSDKVKSLYRSVETKLICYCCGTPFIYGFDEDVRNVMEGAVMLLSEGLYPEEFIKAKEVAVG